METILEREIFLASAVRLERMRILIADDDEQLVELLERFFRSLGHDVILAKDGVEASAKARDVYPDLIVLDIEMPGKSGYEVCRDLRHNFSTRYIPILFLTGRSDMAAKIAGFTAGADDFLTKPFHPDELKVRAEGLLIRNKQILAANPLTKLPGGTLIEEEAMERIRAGRPLAFAYIDIDHFKAYNDMYGYRKGDDVIVRTATILLEAVRTKGNPEDFIGHIGGDDFVLITDPGRAWLMADFIAQEFDRFAASCYSDQHRGQGFIEALDRQGARHQFPLMSLSLAIVTNQARSIEHYGQLVEIVSELKKYAKTATRRPGSFVVIDRRMD